MNILLLSAYIAFPKNQSQQSSAHLAGIFFFSLKEHEKKSVFFVPFLRKQTTEKADTLMSEKVPVQIQANVLGPDLCRVLVASRCSDQNTVVILRTNHNSSV